MNGGNSSELAKKEDIDGFLVGGASLKVHGFSKVSLTQVSSVQVWKSLIADSNMLLFLNLLFILTS